MMRRLLFLLALGALITNASRLNAAAMTPGAPVPAVTVSALSGRMVALPLRGAAGPTVLIVGFSRESAPLCQAWGERLVDERAATRPHIFAMPVIEGVPKLMHGMVLSAIRKTTGSVDQDNVVPLFDRAWAPIAAIVNTSVPNVIVIDRSGAVVIDVPGTLNDDRFAQVRAALRSVA